MTKQYSKQCYLKAPTNKYGQTLAEIPINLLIQDKFELNSINSFCLLAQLSQFNLG